MRVHTGQPQEWRALLRKPFSIALIGAVFAGAVAATASEGEVREAKRLVTSCLEIVDPESGAVVGKIDGYKGCGRVVLYGNKGSMSVELLGGNARSGAAGAGLVIRDSAGSERVRVTVGREPSDAVVLELTDQFEKESGNYPPRIEAILLNHQPCIVLHGADGKETGRLPRE